VRGLVALALALIATAPAAARTSDWRSLDPENALVIDTTRGRVIVEMAPEAAPQHVARIKQLARQGFYDGLVFFRVIDRFMAQTGDPQNTGEGGSTLPNLKAEFTFRRGPETPFARTSAPMGAETGLMGSLPVVSQAMDYAAMTPDHRVAAWATYCPGVVGMARDEDPDSANSQFFFMRQAYPSLDKRYTAWGRVVAGLDVVRAIRTGEPVSDPDRMTRVRVLSDLPAAGRPQVRILDTAGPRFGKLLRDVRRRRGADFSVCDIDLPVQVR
jgi:peptidylprolyl isomerase